MPDPTHILLKIDDAGYEVSATVTASGALRNPLSKAACCCADGTSGLRHSVQLSVSRTRLHKWISKAPLYGPQFALYGTNG